MDTTFVLPKDIKITCDNMIYCSNFFEKVHKKASVLNNYIEVINECIFHRDRITVGFRLLIEYIIHINTISIECVSASENHMELIFGGLIKDKHGYSKYKRINVYIKISQHEYLDTVQNFYSLRYKQIQ